MFDWLKSISAPGPRVETYPDALALKRESAWQGIRKAIDRQLHTDPLLLLVAHFPSTFFEIQDRLAAWQIDYIVPQQEVRPLTVPLAGIDDTQAKVMLVLSELLRHDDGQAALDNRHSISIIGVELHPLPHYDQRVRDFARQLPHPAKMGYIVSIEDPAVAPFVGPWAEPLLRQWGMNDVDLVTSDLVSRRVLRARKWMQQQIVHEEPAESPREWLEKNGAATRYATAIQSYLDSTAPESS